MNLEEITPVWNLDNVNKINSNFQNLARMKTEIFSELSTQEITLDRVGLPIIRRTSTLRVNNYGVVFTSKIDSYLAGFSVFATKEGLVEFYLTDYAGAGNPATVEYKRIRINLNEGLNQVQFIIPLKSNQSYALACKFIDLSIELTASGSTWINDTNMQNPHLLQPITGYSPVLGNTSTAYMYFFDLELASSAAAMIITSQNTHRFFQVSQDRPENDSVLWIRPRSGG